jgi:phiEco32-like amidoligase-type 2 protein
LQKDNNKDMRNNTTQVMFGSDPEGFLNERNDVIGSELVIPDGGIQTNGGRIVRDGVQFELHPLPEPTVAGLGHNLSRILTVLEQTANRAGKQLNFSGLVTVKEKQLQRLAPESQVLGCAPSENIYDVPPIDVDGRTYRKRSSGGHIHLGMTAPIYIPEEGVDHRQRAVALLDVLVGNTGVMLDRDKGARERRKNYGRAGEHRRPEHGLEYRTLSNFWLAGYPVMSLMFGMSRFAVAILQETLAGNDLERELAGMVDLRLVFRAIQSNNFELAMLNYQRIVPFLKANLPDAGYGLTPATVDALAEFANNVRREGLDRWFPKQTIPQRWYQDRLVEFNEWI